MPRKKRDRDDVYVWGRTDPEAKPVEPQATSFESGRWQPVEDAGSRFPRMDPQTIRPRFTPAAPVESAELFAGRSAQAQRLLNAIYDKGQHVVMFGERGVGKTSLALVTTSILPSENWNAFRVTCDARDTFASLWSRVLGRLSVMAGDVRLPDDASAAEVFKAIAGARGQSVIFIDEFDRIPDPQVSYRMADLIKMLSDERHDITVIVIGVADQASRLVVAHPSVQRALVEIHLPRMTMDELRQVVEKATSAMHIPIDERGSDIIAYLSFGLPYFAHLVGLAASRAALEDAESLQIGVSHIRAGIRAAAMQMPELLRIAYDKIVSVPDEDAVLVASALAEKDRDRFFGPDGFNRAFAFLYPERDATEALTRPRDWGAMVERRDDSMRPWRFVDVLFAPFAVLRALSEQRVDEERLLALFADYEARFADATELAFPFFDPDAKQGLQPSDVGEQRATRRPPPPSIRTPPPPPPPARKPPPPPPK